MSFFYSFILSLLIFTTITGFIVMLISQEYVKKICCLSICYSSFLLFIILLSFQNGDRFAVILTIMVSVLIVFATNLLIAIALAKNLEKNN